MPPPRRLRGPLHPSQLALRNTTSLLNKLAEANFDTISAQIIALVEQSAAKDDGGTISMLSQTCLDAAVAQTPRVDLYARLCRAVLEQSSTLLFASGPRTSEGKTMTGGQAFRYYLLNPLYRRVQAGDTSDTSKRHYLGTVKFLADLAREDMVPVAKMHECIKNSLSAAAFLSQIDLEAVCIILKTSGSLLDVPESRVQMEVYFERIEDLKRSTMIPARSRFMLQDICDLRARQWVALQSTVEQDLGLTSPVQEGILLGSGTNHSLNPVLDTPGLGSERGNDTTDQANSDSIDLPSPYFALLTNLSTATAIFEAISAALSLPPSTNLPAGQFPLSMLEDWLIRISLLATDLAIQRAEARDLKATMERMIEKDEDLAGVRDILEKRRDTEHQAIVERLKGHLSASLEKNKQLRNNLESVWTAERETVDRMTAQLSASRERIEKLTQERDTLEQTGNAENKATVERLTGQLSASVEKHETLTRERNNFQLLLTAERATVERMSAQVSLRGERIDGLTRERDVLQKSRNLEQTRSAKHEATVERLRAQLSASVEKNETLTRERNNLEAKWTAERETVERMSAQASARGERIEELTRQRDVLEKSRNAEQMHRIEVQTKLRAAESMALKSGEDLRKSRDHCVDLAAQLERAKQDLQAQKQELLAQKIAEVSRTNAARKEGEEAARSEMMHFLRSKEENAQRARQAEEDRIKAEEEAKVQREKEAARKVEQQLGLEQERLRCLKRDEKYRNAAPWTEALALERFEKVLIVDEFTRFKFSDNAPLTFDALPWPVLNRPGMYNTGHITAQTVRAFFTARAMLSASSVVYPIPADYRRYLIKQGLLAFHGDKMVSRISTVDDPSVRQQIHDAANIVTRTLNDLMR